MRRVLIPAGLLALASCTPAEEAAWLAWWRQEPSAAVEYLYDSGIVSRPTQEPDSEPGADTAGVYEPWISLAECESDGNWHIATGNGYYGGLQFALGSWHAVGGEGYPHHASPSEQVYRAERLLDLQGWGAWPACSAQLGLR